MGAALQRDQGLEITTIGTPQYDAQQRTLRRVTQVVAIDRNGPLTNVAGVLQQHGLKLGMSLHANHRIRSFAYAVGAPGAMPAAAAFQTLASDPQVTQELRNTFSDGGGWVGYRIPPMRNVPQAPAMFFQLEVTGFQPAHAGDAYVVPVAAVLGNAGFRDHFVLGISVFTVGAATMAGSVDFATRVVAVVSPQGPGAQRRA